MAFDYFSKARMQYILTKIKGLFGQANCIASLDANAKLDANQIPTNVIQKSNTAGLVKNDGTIDTNSYATTSQIPDISGKADKSEMSVSTSGDKTTIQLKSGTSAEVLSQHQDISDKAEKSEMSVTDGTGADADKTTIQLKSGTSATVLKTHQDISGKVDKETGKGLSTNDYTTNEKNKLVGIAAGATKTASSTTNGNIKINDVETQVYDDSDIQDKIDETTTSISGNPISISGLKANQLAINPIITLEPIQAGSGTPSPSNIRAISGYDKVEALSCGKNFFNAFFKKALDYWGASYTYDSNTDSYTITYIGTSYSNPYEFFESPKYLSLSAVSITNLGTGTNWSIQIYDENARSWRQISSAQLSYNNIYGNKIRINYSTIGNGATFTKVQLEESASATTYEPCNKATSISESLGQTVYGGTWYPRTGELVVDMAFYTTTWTATGGTVLGNCTRQNLCAISNAKGSDVNKKDISNVAELIVSWSGDITHFYIDTSSKALVVTLPNSTPEGTVLQFAYELATPFTIQLTPHEISLLKDYAYVSTNGTTIALDYHNGEMASLADVSQLGETLNNGLIPFTLDISNQMTKLLSSATFKAYRNGNVVQIAGRTGALSNGVNNIVQIPNALRDTNQMPIPMYIYLSASDSGKVNGMYIDGSGIIAASANSATGNGIIFSVVYVLP